MLVARVKAHLAQVERLQPSPAEPAVLTVGPLTAKLDARQIFKNGVELPLKNREYELCCFSCATRGRCSAGRTCMR